jgi:hypothetical protein
MMFNLLILPRLADRDGRPHILTRTLASLGMCEFRPPSWPEYQNSYTSCGFLGG